MASLRAQLFNRYVRMTMKSKDLVAMPPEKLRSMIEKSSIPPSAKGITNSTVSEGGVKGEWHTPEYADEARVIYYLHGGGYTFGSPRTHCRITYALARQTTARVFSLDYRMAPEDVFPAAVDDAVAGYEWLLAQGISPEKISVGGDSAGGGLALALLLALKRKCVALPACAFLYSPWTDMTVSGGSVVENAERDAMFMAGMFPHTAKRYLGDWDHKDPLASPLFGDFSGLPPMLVFASKSEALRDDTVRLVEAARNADVQVEDHLYDGLVHIWPAFTPFFPEAVRDVKRTAEFIVAGTR